jgi:mRNA interferase RelE/StbE
VARYAIEILPSAERALSALDKPHRERIGARIDALATNPRPAGIKKLHGDDNVWRLRVGEYRVIYEIHDRRLVVTVVKVGHRREVYRR